MPKIRSILPERKESEEAGLLEKLLKLVETVGLEPGDMMGGMGSVVKKAGKVIKFPSNMGDSMLRNHDIPLSPKLRNEFNPVQPGPQAPLEHDEVRKMLDLLDQGPRPKK